MKALYRRPLLWLVLVASLSTWVGVGSAKGATGAASSIPQPLSSPIASDTVPVSTSLSDKLLPPIGKLPTCKKLLYKVRYYDPTEGGVPKGVRDSIAKALCFWPGETPSDNTFSVVSMRMEDDWGYVALTYDTASNEKRRALDDHGVTMETTNIVYRMTSAGWQAAVTGDKAFNALLWAIPDTKLSRNAKERLSVDSEGIRATTVSATTAGQAYYGHQLPWPANDSYRLGTLKWHQGASIDFIPTGQGAQSSEIVAAAGGTITSICHVDSTDQAWIHVNSADGNFKYLHLSWNSVEAQGYKIGDLVEQGQFLAVLSANRADEEFPCKMKSDTAHLHFTFPYKPFRIDGLYFGSLNSEIPGSFPSTQCSPRPKPDGSKKPIWVIDTGRNQDGRTRCSIKGDITNLVDNQIGIGNVSIKNNLAVTVDSRSDKCVNVPDCSIEDQKHRIPSQLNLDFINQKLEILSGASLLINKETKVY